MMTLRQIKGLILCIVLTGCGYHMGDYETQDASSHTVSVPYIEGDGDGKLTDALIKAIGHSTRFSYANHGDLTLKAVIVGESLSHIGWQYDREPVSGERINRLVPNEGRREIKIRVSLLSENSGKVLYGPVEVAADSDFDFVDSDSLLDTSFLSPDGNRQSVLFFSLGQLDSIDGAFESSLTPLFSKVAHKIVEGLENSHLN